MPPRLADERGTRQHCHAPSNTPSCRLFLSDGTASHLSSWRRQYRKGAQSGLKPKKRGRKGKSQTPEAKRIAELERRLKGVEREKRRLEAKLKRADLMLEIQKKVSELLGIPLDQPPSDGSDSLRPPSKPASSRA